MTEESAAVLINNNYLRKEVLYAYNGNDDGISCEYIESKLNKRGTGLLTQYVKMIIVASGKCK